MNVFLGKTVAAGTWPPPWRLFVQRRPDLASELTIRWQTQPLVNNGLVVRSDVPDSDLKTVTGVILGLHKNTAGKNILVKMGLSRFENANSATFDVVRRFLNRYHDVFGKVR